MRRTLDLGYRRMRRRISKTFVRIPVVWCRHRGLTEQDAFIAGYARTGTVWLRFMLYEILTGEAATFDRVNKHIPDVGRQRCSARILPGDGRLLKTHERYRKEYGKAIYMVRDPRDIVISEYAYYQQSRRINASFEQFLEMFVQGKSNGYGSWANHVQSWLNSPIATSNLLVIRFEELKSNTESVLTRALEFFGANAKAERIRTAIANNTFAKMQHKEIQSPRLLTREGHRYIREGSTGGWRTNLLRSDAERVAKSAGELLQKLEYETGDIGA